MSEELYLRYEMKYLDSMKKEVETEVKKRMAEMARDMIIEGIPLDTVEKVSKIPHDEVLRMNAELNGTP